MKIVVTLLICVFYFVAKGQSNPEKFTGKWYATGIHTIEINDTIEFVKGEFDKENFKEYIMWNFLKEGGFEIEALFQADTNKNEFGEIMLTTFDVYWKYIEKDNILRANGKRYIVSHIDEGKLKVIRMY